MIRILLIMTACFFSCFLLAVEAPVRLQYLSDIPIRQTSKLTIDIDESFPNFKLNAKSKQSLQFILTIVTEQPDLPILQPPFDLTLVLKDFTIDLNANEESTAFDAKNPGSSIHMAQFSQMLDKPIHLRFNEDFTIQIPSQDLEKFTRELPVLKDIKPEIFLNELFQPLFALIGKDLFVGFKFQHKVPTEPDIPVPAVVNYEVTDIDDQAIVATFYGTIEPKTITLSSPLQFNKETNEIAELMLSGSLQGDISWNRKNALLYGLQAEYLYKGILKFGEWEWMMHVTIVHKVSSSKL
jgi:hypothetical protein